MRRTLVGLSLVVVAAMVTPAEAQLGGMMRRAKEAAEKKTAPEPASTQNPFSDPAVVFITQDQLARFEKGLQFEIDQRNALRASASKATKSQAEYQACTQSAAMSPEMMKAIQDWSEEAAKLPPEKAVEAVTKMTSAQAAVVEKHCGPDPSKTQGNQFERLRQIEAEASDIAMPPGYKAPAGSQGRLENRPGDFSAFLAGASPNANANVALSYRAPRAYFPSFEARAQASSAHPFARAYGMLKERIPVYCSKDKKVSAPQTITVGGEKMTIVRVQEASGGLQYAFRQDEVEVLNAGCASVMAKMNALFDTANK